MANKKTKVNIPKLNADVMRVIFVVLGSIFTTLVLVFAVLAILEIQKDDLTAASIYLLGIFIVLGLTRLITFLKEKTKISFIRFLTLFVLNVAFGIMALFGKNNPYMYAIVGGCYCLTIILSRVFKLIQNHSIRSIIFNGIIILLATLLAIGLFVPDKSDSVSVPVLVTCFVIAIASFVEVVSNASGYLRVGVLLKIVVRTFALEVILGLFAIIVAFSLIFMLTEPDINSFGEGLWYCFAVVTTIGFGDYTATTLLGRVLTVILGTYGIIVVAVITSIIVNFYNETAGKKDSQEIKEIKDEERAKK